MPRTRAPSPGELERERHAACRCEVDVLWRRFSSEGPLESLGHRERALVSFAAYATREYLFCGYRGPKRCGAVTLEHVKTFLLDTAPHDLVVDDPRGFIEQTKVWLGWLLGRGVFTNANEIARGLRRGAWRKDLVERMTAGLGGASKELVLQAREAGIDLADRSALLDYLASLRPSDASWAEFCREFADPPCPVFDRGRTLYAFGWPPPPEVPE